MLELQRACYGCHPIAGNLQLKADLEAKAKRGDDATLRYFIINQVGAMETSLICSQFFISVCLLCQETVKEPVGPMGQATRECAIH